MSEKRHLKPCRIIGHRICNSHNLFRQCLILAKNRFIDRSSVDIKSKDLDRQWQLVAGATYCRKNKLIAFSIGSSIQAILLLYYRLNTNEAWENTEARLPMNGTAQDHELKPFLQPESVAVIGRARAAGDDRKCSFTVGEPGCS